MNISQVIRVAISLVLLVPFLAHSLGYLSFGFVDRLENIAYDARVILSMPRTRDDRIVIVDIDERSLEAEGGWPWPRDKFARMVDQLFDKYHVKVVGFDIVFPERSRNEDLQILESLAVGPLGDSETFQSEYSRIKPELRRDEMFATSLQGRPTVMGYLFRSSVTENEARALGMLPPPAIPAAEDATNIDAQEPAGYTGNIPILQQAAAGGGFFENELLDVDGVFRRVPVLRRFNGAYYESLSLALTRKMLGDPPIVFEFHSGPSGPRDNLDLEVLRVGKYRIPVDEQLGMLIPYRGGSFSFPYVSATDVISGEAPMYPLANSIVLVGTTAPGLFDLRNTPVGQRFAGVEVHANVISGILDQTIKHQPKYVQGIAAVMLAFIAALLTFALPRLPVLTGALFTLLIIVAVAALNYSVWTKGNLLLPLASPILLALSIAVLQMLYGFKIESRGKRHLSSLFGQYVPPELVEELGSRSGGATMTSESREMTVLFSDVRGFTGIAESLRPRELSQLMNEFLTPMTKVIHRHRGTIDKYIGDAIMAFWGAPLDDADHARNAMIAAVEMQGALQALNPEFKKRGWPEVQIGIGINTGRMRVGNMGSEFRMAYTVMGDAVNLGSRLEGLTKHYGVKIITGEGTAEAVPDWAFMQLDRVRVKGKDKPVAVFEPIGPRASLDADTRAMLSRHRHALRAYREADWDSAEREFFNLYQSYPERRIFQIYLDRITHFRSQPPNAEWSGVFKSLSK